MTLLVESSEIRPAGRVRCGQGWTWLVHLVSVLVVMTTASVASSKEMVMPSFSFLPAPLIYYTDSSVKLKCVARPQTAKVRIMYRRRGDTIFNLVTRDVHGSVSYTIDKPDVFEDTDIHCVARTESLGRFLSRPVRLKRTRLSVKNSGSRLTTKQHFYKGNIAQVLCKIPKSEPPAEIEFYKDDDKIGDQTQHSKDKYKMVKLPHMDTMALLIKDFSTSDQGMYSCKAKNPVTLQSVDLPRRERLQMITSSRGFVAKFRVDDPFQKSIAGQKVELREGENATIYCLPEGAPIPTVNWYRHEADKSLPDNAKVDSSFGTLQLVKLKMSDHTEFMCSAKQGTRVITTAISVKVRKRLKIITAPQNVKVKQLGVRAKFTCMVAGGTPQENIRPEWYHNGEYIDPNQRREMIVDTRTESSPSSATRTVQHSSLTIRSVTTDLLGIYQCVARSQSEWDSAAAALLMSDQELITGAEKDRKLAAEREAKRKREQERRRMKERRKELKRKSRKNKLYPDRGIAQSSRIDSNFNPPPTDWTSFHDGGNQRPLVRERSRTTNRLTMGPRLTPSSRQTNVQPNVIDKPRVQIIFDNMAVELKWKYRGTKKVNYYRVQYRERDVQRDRSSTWDMASINSIADEIHTEYFYVLKSLKPGNEYRFRVSVVYLSGESVTSEWSNEVDFSHVLDVKPTIVEVKQEGSEALRIAWRYVPLTSFDGRSQILSQFRILVRRQIDKDRYDGYVRYDVQSDRRELLVNNLRPGTNYQIVMYGVVEGKGGQRSRITRFSNQVSKATALVGGGKPRIETPPGKRHSSAESTKLMFWILGGLAGVMLVVMTFLIGLCLLRQRREKKRSRAAHQAQVNGTSLDAYKDPAKFMQRRPQAQAHANNQFLLAQLGGNAVPGGPNQNGTWSGPHAHHQSASYLRGSSASIQQLHQVPGSAMNLNVVPETQSLMMDHYHQQQNHQTPDMTTDLGGYPHSNMYHQHGHHNGTLGSKSQLSGITSHHPHHPDQDMVDNMGYPINTGSVGPYRPLGSGYAPFMNSGQRPSHLDVRPTPCGDAESIYSYFSQQEMGVQHCGLNDVPGGPPMPYRPQLAEAGSQTTDRQQHRHHRRRRRKQASVPPTGPGGPLPTAMEHSVNPSPPMMRDMAVNTELGTSEGTYDQPATSHLPYGYHMAGGVPMAQYLPQDSSGGATASSAASSTPAYHCVTPPARIASLGPHHGYHYPQQQQQQHQQQQLQQQQQQQVDLGPAGPSDASTLTRRGTPTLFVDPPKMRDYSEYAIPETKA